MSIDTFVDLTEEQKAAWDLINESNLLKNDPYAKKVVEAGGLADNGVTVDIGDFLAARQAVLEMNQAEGKVVAAKRKNPEAYEVAYSVAPHLESNL